jgi:putative tricarboxylic transport membrane protein
MNDNKTNKADFIDSIFIIAFSLFVIYRCLVMPRYESWGLYATPGMPPLIFALILLALAAIVFVRSIIRKGYKLEIGRHALTQFVKSGDVHRFSIALGLILLYFVFLGRLPFVILSAVFLFVTVMMFKGAKWWVSAVVSVLTAVIVWLVFEVVFLVPLP